MGKKIGGLLPDLDSVRAGVRMDAPPPDFSLPSPPPPQPPAPAPIGPPPPPGGIPTQPSNFSNELTPPAPPPAMPTSAHPWMAGANNGPTVPPTTANPATPPAMPDPAIGPNSIQQGQDQQPKVPPQTKAHKLLMLLQGGLQGAMAGRASSEQALAQSGGHRSGGVGAGFEAGYTLPWQRAQMQQAVQRGGLENELLGSQVKYAPALNFLKMLEGQANVGKTQAETGKATAETGKATAETGAIPQKEALEKAQAEEAAVRAEAANYKEDPNLGLVDIRTKQPINPNGIAPLTAAEAQVLGKQPGERVPIKVKNTANEIAMRGMATVNTEEGVFERNRQANTMTRLGSNPRAIFAPSERIIEVANPNSPGNTEFVKAGEARAQGLGGTKGAEVQVPRQAMKSEVPTKIGDQKIAFQTMNDHAELLRKAARALNNGDNQTLNSLKNKFNNEFGKSGPITAQAIADAYGGEVNFVISKGHITDTGNEKIAHTLDPTAQNFKTVDSVLGAYQALAKSKMQNLIKQEHDAVSASQNNGGSGSGGASAKDPLGIR